MPVNKLKFSEECYLNESNELDRAKYLSFYYYKEFQNEEFTNAMLGNYFSEFGYSKPNPSRLRSKLISNKILKENKIKMLVFVPIVLEKLESEFGYLWNDHVTIISDSEVLDENTFCIGRGYIDNLVKHINCTYRENCYDATAVLMRRLFEILLILLYRNCGVDNEIKNSDGTHKELKKIVDNSLGNSSLGLSRIKEKFHSFRELGNLSAHRIEYITGKQQVDDVVMNYRAAMQELYHKSGLM